MSELGPRLVSLLGFAAMIAIAWGFSTERRLFPWRTVLAGCTAQLGLGVLLLKTPVGRAFFEAMRFVVDAFIWRVRRDRGNRALVAQDVAEAAA